MHHARRPLCGRRPGHALGAAGFGLVEIMIATMLLVVGCLGLLGATVAGVRVLGVNRERAHALAAAHTMIERLKDTTFALLFATYNKDPNDDPGAPGSAPGANFVVPGLSPCPGDLDGMAGKIVFPTLGGAGLQLSESIVDARWGMPRDLNGDGAQTAGALVGPYVILPVRVRIVWCGLAGKEVLELDDLLVDHGN